jgi:hypothetical protein
MYQNPEKYLIGKSIIEGRPAIREVLYTAIITYTDSKSDVWVVKLDDGTIAGVTINKGVFCDRPIGNLMELLQQINSVDITTAII